MTRWPGLPGRASGPGAHPGSGEIRPWGTFTARDTDQGRPPAGWNLRFVGHRDPRMDAAYAGHPGESVGWRCSSGIVCPQHLKYRGLSLLCSCPAVMRPASRSAPAASSTIRPCTAVPTSRRGTRSRPPSGTKTSLGRPRSSWELTRPPAQPSSQDRRTRSCLTSRGTVGQRSNTEG